MEGTGAAILESVGIKDEGSARLKWWPFCDSDLETLRLRLIWKYWIIYGHGMWEKIQAMKAKETYSGPCAQEVILVENLRRKEIVPPRNVHDGPNITYLTLDEYIYILSILYCSPEKHKVLCENKTCVYYKDVERENKETHIL